MDQRRYLKPYADEVKLYIRLRIPIKMLAAEAEARALGTSPQGLQM
jgi:hypothetical protein